METRLPEMFPRVSVSIRTSNTLICRNLTMKSLLFSYADCSSKTETCAGQGEREKESMVLVVVVVGVRW
ncbi:hypothetical protein Hanom_Chr15g01357521 [Helianthus anomalus]